MDNRLYALGLALFVFSDTLYIRSDRLRCDYARVVLDSYTDAEFRADFRVSRLVFDFIVQSLQPYWKGRLQIETAVLMFLYDVATGESYRSLATRFGVVKSTVAKYTVYVAELINCHLKYFVTYDLSEEELGVQQRLFGHYYNQPDAVGAMDGVFIPIKKPAKNGEGYYSGHKKRYGMMMLAVCDFNCRFLYVVCGNSSRVGDSLVFNTSNLK